MTSHIIINQYLFQTIFFFQAEDGIRDYKVTGVQTCALPISSGGPSIVLLADPSDPVAPQMVQGLLQKVTMTAAPDLMMVGGLKQFEEHAGALTPQQRKAMDKWLPALKANAGTSTASTGAAGTMGMAVEVVDVMRTDD